MHAVSTNQIADILHFNDKDKKSVQTLIDNLIQNDEIFSQKNLKVLIHFM